MKTEDLRIGNLVTENKSNHIIDKYDFYNAQLFDPIPLTEIVIKSLSHEESVFNSSEGKVIGFYIGENNFTIAFAKGKFYSFTQIDSESWGYVENEIKYLHELQNMVYWYNNNKENLIINL